MKKQIIQDRNGNELTYFNGLWWSRNFDRFLQLLTVRGGPPVMVCSIQKEGNPKFIRCKGAFRRIYWWNKWEQYGWAFLDPETQTIYPGQREIDETSEGCYYEKKSVS